MPGTYAHRMLLTAKIRRRPHAGSRTVDDLELRDITAEADDYGQAMSKLEEQTPDDWQMLYVREH